mgnify:CR=1 FL=1
MVNKANIPSEISLIYGLPGQTVESFKYSIAKCQALVPKANIKCFPLMLLRGTKLHDSALDLGLREGTVELHGIQEFIPHVVETPTMTQQDWQTMHDIAVGLGNGEK